MANCQVSVSGDEDSFVHWADLEGEKREGVQLFSINAVPREWSYFRFIIHEVDF